VAERYIIYVFLKGYDCFTVEGMYLFFFLHVLFADQTPVSREKNI